MYGRHIFSLPMMQHKSNIIRLNIQNINHITKYKKLGCEKSTTCATGGRV